MDDVCIFLENVKILEIFPRESEHDSTEDDDHLSHHRWQCHEESTTGLQPLSITYTRVLPPLPLLADLQGFGGYSVSDGICLKYPLPKSSHQDRLERSWRPNNSLAN